MHPSNGEAITTMSVQKMSFQKEISRTRAVTLEDVANELGLSHQTVSRVINNHPRVLPATRVRVLHAIQKFGYRPNRAARFLANRRSSLFGLVTVGVKEYGPAHLILAVEHEAQKHGLTLMIHALRDFNVAAIQQAVSELLANSALGVLVDVPFELPKRELREALGKLIKRSLSWLLALRTSRAASNGLIGLIVQ